MRRSADPFAVLGLDPATCSATDIDFAHRGLMMLHHPDVNGTTEDAVAINLAREEAHRLLAQRTTAEPPESAEPVDDGAPEWAATSTSYGEPAAPAPPQERLRVRRGFPQPLRAAVLWLPLLFASILTFLPAVPPPARLLLIAAFTLRALNGFLHGGGHRG